MIEHCSACGLIIVQRVSLATGVCAVCRRGERASAWSGPWQWSACVETGDAPCYLKGTEDGEAMMVALDTAWGRRGRPTRCTAHYAAVTEVLGG